MNVREAQITLHRRIHKIVDKDFSTKHTYTSCIKSIYKKEYFHDLNLFIDIVFSTMYKQILIV